MALTPKQLGRNMRSARERMGITQAEAAARVGVSTGAISRIESGQRQLSSLELTELADFYGRPLDWFVAADNPEQRPDPFAALFRAEPGLQAPQARRQVADALRLLRAGAAMKRVLHRIQPTVLPHYALPAARQSGSAAEQGRQVAAHERRRLDLGSAPIRHLRKLIGGQGIWVADLPLPDRISGLFLNGADFGTAIAVNAAQTPARQRFSLAHEYGHAVMDRDGPATVSRRDDDAPAEQRANAFAAAFLLPEPGVRGFLRARGKELRSRNAATGARARQLSCVDAALLAQHFGVSYPAAVWRLRNLKLAGPGEAKKLLAQAGGARRYLRATGEERADAPEPACAGGELGRQVLTLALEAWRCKEISRGRLMEIGRFLSIDNDTIFELAEAAGA